MSETDEIEAVINEYGVDEDLWASYDSWRYYHLEYLSLDIDPVKLADAPSDFDLPGVLEDQRRRVRAKLEILRQNTENRGDLPVTEAIRLLPRHNIHLPERLIDLVKPGRCELEFSTSEWMKEEEP